jgi:hypothetical protein
MRTITVPCPTCRAGVGDLCVVVRPRTRWAGFRYNPVWGYIHARRVALAAATT